MKQEAIHTKANCHVLQQFQGQCVHQVVVTLVGLMDPLVFLLWRKRSVLVQSILEMIVADLAY